MNDRPIFLVGFMGCGKTTLGRLLAAEMHWDFLDLDEELIKRDGRQIKDIFEQNGEEFFRGVETATLSDIAQRKRTVIALGGGTFISHENRSVIRSAGLSIFLNCSFPTVLSRVQDDRERPLNKSKEQLEELFAQRLSAYKEAEIEINVDGLSPVECVAAVQSAIASLPAAIHN